MITKADLLPHVAFDLERAVEQILTLRPDACVLLTSTVDGRGLDSWCGLLQERLVAKRQAQPVA